MLKAFLGALVGTGLYLFSNSTAGENRVAFYLAGMAVLALTCTWALRAAVAASRAQLRTATYLLRSKRIVTASTPERKESWAPLVESTKVVRIEDMNAPDAVRTAVSA